MRLLFHLFGDRIVEKWDSLSSTGRYLVAAGIALLAFGLDLMGVRRTGGVWVLSCILVVATYFRIGDGPKCPRDLD